MNIKNKKKLKFGSRKGCGHLNKMLSAEGLPCMGVRNMTLAEGFINFVLHVLQDLP